MSPSLAVDYNHLKVFCPQFWAKFHLKKFPKKHHFLDCSKTKSKNLSVKKKFFDKKKQV